MPTPSLIIPSAPVYDEGNLYGLNVYGTQFAPEAIPFTRATTATRTNSAGLVELVPYNLVRYSEMFADASWVKLQSSISSNVTTAPDGTLTADTLVENNTNAAHLTQQLINSSGASYTFSVYAKAKERSKIMLFVPGASSKGYGFDLANGTMSAVTSVAAADSFSITNVGNGWYRCSIVVNTTSITRVEIYTLQDFSNYIYLGDGTSGVFIWGAQLVEGTAALPYLKTETRLNRPRVDFSLGGCPNLLLEPQRTNLALRSQEFDNTTTWTSGISGTGVNPIITANTTISPSGVQDADTIVFNRGAGNTLSDQSLINQQITIATTGTYYFSVWLKATASGDIGKQVFIRCGSAGSLQAVTLTANWVRYETTASVTAGANSFQIGSRGTITTSNSVSVDLWGAQLELGAYATTYIPTTTTSVTRNADSFTESNIFSRGMITAAGGTWFVELRNNRVLTRDGADNGLQFTDALGVFGFRIKTFGTARMFIAKVVSSTESNLYNTLTDTIKVAIKWNGSTADVFVNGVKVVASTSFSDTQMQIISCLSSVPKYIQQMALYPTPLSDTECINLTTL